MDSEINDLHRCEGTADAEDRDSSRQRPATPREVLIVDGENPLMRHALANALGRAGFRCREAPDAMRAQTAIVASRPDLVLLDWLLPGMSGLDYLRLLKQRSETRGIPVVVLSAHADECEAVMAFESGADDYVAKPVGARELIARIRAILRRAPRGHDTQRISISGLTLDLVGHRVLAQGRNCRMSPGEYRLLEFFMRHPGVVYRREQLIEAVWASGKRLDPRSVDVHVRRLRKALAQVGCDALVQTVHGVGYRFAPRV